MEAEIKKNIGRRRGSELRMYNHVPSPSHASTILATVRKNSSFNRISYELQFSTTKLIIKRYRLVRFNRVVYIHQEERLKYKLLQDI